MSNGTEPLSLAHLDAIRVLQAAAANRIETANFSEVSTAWRLVYLDYSPSIAPVCTAEGVDDEHAVLEDTGERDNLGVYDCCPWPQIEVRLPELAEYLVALLNAAPALLAEGGAR